MFNRLTADTGATDLNWKHKIEVWKFIMFVGKRERRSPKSEIVYLTFQNLVETNFSF